ncbi:MAG: hypothetical protein ABIH42_05275 [Planctomycetota bacterium]
MTDITTTSTVYKSVGLGIKVVTFVTPATAATGDTIDMHLDDTLAEGKTILATLLQNTTGTTVASATFSNTTGVITLPTISTGAHKLTVLLV